MAGLVIGACSGLVAGWCAEFRGIREVQDRPAPCGMAIGSAYGLFGRVFPGAPRGLEQEFLEKKDARGVCERFEVMSGRLGGRGGPSRVQIGTTGGDAGNVGPGAWKKARRKWIERLSGSGSAGRNTS